MVRRKIEKSARETAQTRLPAEIVKETSNRHIRVYETKSERKKVRKRLEFSPFTFLCNFNFFFLSYARIHDYIGKINTEHVVKAWKPGNSNAKFILPPRVLPLLPQLILPQLLLPLLRNHPQRATIQAEFLHLFLLLVSRCFEQTASPGGPELFLAGGPKALGRRCPVGFPTIKFTFFLYVTLSLPLTAVNTSRWELSAAEWSYQGECEIAWKVEVA